MGRIFEKRKHKIFARMDRMAKAFTRIGREIAIAVKQGGPNPEYNPRLRMAMQNAKGINMPKDRVEAAIKRASSKDEKGYEEVTYEGYGPHGVAIVAECATDNTTRTVSNVRVIFTRNNGNLGKSGSLDFIFERKGVFKLKPEGLNKEELELELIDYGADEITEDEEGNIIIYTKFSDFGAMQKGLESKNIVPVSAEVQRIPNTLVELNEAQEEEVLKMVADLEEDDDVQAVYHNIA
jgi:YebC/PmpR family DNA-binding regulatory protein